MTDTVFIPDVDLSYAQVVYDTGRSYPDMASDVFVKAFTDTLSATAWLQKLNADIMTELAKLSTDRYEVSDYVDNNTGDLNVSVHFKTNSIEETSTLTIEYRKARMATRCVLDDLLREKGVSVIDDVVTLTAKRAELTLYKKSDN